MNETRNAQSANDLIRSFLQRPTNEPISPEDEQRLYNAIDQLANEHGSTFPIEEYTIDFVARFLERSYPSDLFEAETRDEYLRSLAEHVADYYGVYDSDP